MVLVPKACFAKVTIKSQRDLHPSRLRTDHVGYPSRRAVRHDALSLSEDADLPICVEGISSEHSLPTSGSRALVLNQRKLGIGKP